MRVSISSLRRAGAPCALLCAALAAGSGCTELGPASIASGRAAYNDIITRTNDEQLLNMLVRMRYGETTTLLLVSAITAQTQMTLSSGIQAGTGPRSNYEGNLVPFSLNGSYSETPTISYTPITGEKYLKELITPIGLDLYGLLVDSASDTESMLELLTAGLAGLDCPVSYESPRAAELARALTLMAHLRRAAALSFAYTMDAQRNITGVQLVVADPGGTQGEEVAELLRLLRHDAPRKAGETLHIPLQAGRMADGSDALPLQTRSILELLRLAARGVDVPAVQLASGVAPAQETASAQPFLMVHSALEPPIDPFVAVQYRGHWFWVESEDTESKLGFVYMQTLLQYCLHDDSVGQPQLTLPIG